MTALAHRPGDHPGLAEPAAAGAAAEDLDAGPLVDGLGERDQRRARVGPLVEVHDRVLGDPPRHARPVGCDAADATVGQVVDVVEPGDVDGAGARQPQQELVAAAGAALGLVLADDVGDGKDRLLAVADDGRVEELRDRLGVERGVTAGHDEGVVVGAVGSAQRDAGEIEGGEQVGVAELGGEADAEQVEGCDRTVAVDGELRHAVLAHQRLEVGPDAVRPLGQDAVALVEDLVQDLQALVGEPDLVRVRVHQRPADLAGVPVLDDGVELAADVLDRFAHQREQRLQPIEDRLDGHRRPSGSQGSRDLPHPTPPPLPTPSALILSNTPWERGRPRRVCSRSTQGSG